MDEKLPIAEIETQGRILINTCSLLVDEEKVKVLEIDLHTKYAQVGAYGGDSDGVPNIVLGSSNDTIHMDPDETVFELTTISFPRFKGFDSVAADIGRYTCLVLLLDMECEPIETVRLDSKQK